MSSAPVESKRWAVGRWVVTVIVILAGQVGFVFWLSSQKPETPPPVATGPMISLTADQTNDLPGVSDPTLFVLPNAHGFSGPAWLQFPAANYALDAWTEPAQPLELKIPQLGAALAEFAHTNRLHPFELVLKPEPQLDAVGYLPIEETPSFYTVEGDVAWRPLLSPLPVSNSWPAADILTNTEVQVAVDAAGRVFSAVLVSKSGSTEANTSALNLARSARFEPLRWIGDHPPPAAPNGLTWGKIVFRWHTVALPATAGAK